MTMQKAAKDVSKFPESGIQSIKIVDYTDLNWQKTSPYCSEMPDASMTVMRKQYSVPGCICFGYSTVSSSSFSAV